MRRHIDPLEQFMRFDPELAYCKPGESAVERLMRAVDELREYVDTLEKENSTLSGRLYECYYAYAPRLTMAAFEKRLDEGDAPVALQHYGREVSR